MAEATIQEYSTTGPGGIFSVSLLWIPGKGSRKRWQVELSQLVERRRFLWVFRILRRRLIRRCINIRRLMRGRELYEEQLAEAERLARDGELA